MNAVSVNVLVTVKDALSEADKALLRGDGIVVVEADDPSKVRFLTPEGPPMSSNDLFYAALNAVVKSAHYATGQNFAEALLKIEQANRAARERNQP